MRGATRGRGGFPSRPLRRSNHAAFISLLMGSPRKNGRLGDPALTSLSLNSELKIVLVVVIVLVLDLLGLCVETRRESSRTISLH
jgi:hypothetical protein